MHKGLFSHDAISTEDLSYRKYARVLDTDMAYVEGEPNDVVELVDSYTRWLSTSAIAIRTTEEIKDVQLKTDVE